MLSVIMLIVIMLSVLMPIVVRLSVIMQIVVMLSVMAPSAFVAIVALSFNKIPDNWDFIRFHLLLMMDRKEKENKGEL